jgi:lysozyme
MSLIESIKQSEGYRSRVYKCTEGYETIGYGFAIKDLHLDEDICDMILERKLGELKLRIHKEFEFVLDLPESVQDVIIEMCYQMGLSGFSKFKKTIQFLRLGDFKSASTEMLDSRWYRQTPNRAKRLSQIVKYAK